jgi:hypothetical protein
MNTSNLPIAEPETTGSYVTRCATKILQRKSHPTKLEVQPI